MSKAYYHLRSNEGWWVYCGQSEWRFYHELDKFCIKTHKDDNGQLAIIQHRKLQNVSKDLLNCIVSHLLTWIRDCPKTARCKNIYAVVPLPDGGSEALSMAMKTLSLNSIVVGSAL